jgi:hypothetical protein
MAGYNDKGYPRVDQSPAVMAQRRRVRDLLASDRAERAAEQFREEARTRFENGDSASSVDAIIPPTREWEAKGNVASHIAIQDPHSTRLVKTVRRQNVPQARKMLAARIIDLPGLCACEWYSELYEKTGLSGNIPSVDYGREVFSAPHSRTMFTEWQMVAQGEFNEVRKLITVRLLMLLDEMVLRDVPASRAARIARIRAERVKTSFAKAVELLADARKALEE